MSSSDPRFARLRSDPRFRRPKKEKAKVQVDDRFKSVFAPDKKSKKKSSGRVDKYGRILSDTHEQDNIRRFYHLQDADEQGEDSKPIDLARGQVLLESSDEEGPSHAADDSEESELDDFVKVGVQDEDSDEEINLDESQYADLSAQAVAYSNEHPEIEESERTRRLAVVNLDWDHVRAAHLYKICSSLVSPTAPPVASSSRVAESSSRKASTTQARGQVLSVRVLPSEFGKERMTREEKEGPPAELFKKRKDLSEVNAKTIYEVGEEDEVNEDALRKYQLDRLRYYYAIIECDSVEAASHIFDELEGTELERSANVFNLSFVPDDMTFDDAFRDEATAEADTLGKPLDFVTDALRHSKVKLTWDDDDPERQQITRRKFSRKEIEEDNFRAYIASSSESESEARPEKSKQKSQSRDKLRALLLAGNDNDMPEGWGGNGNDEGPSDVDMEITFTPGLSESKGEEDETTIEKYKRKMKEKRKQRKEERNAPKEVVEDKDVDDFFEADTEEDDEADDEEDDNEPVSVAPTKKSVTFKTQTKAADIDLVPDVGADGDDKKHFDLKAILRAEKGKGKIRHKKKKAETSTDETQPDFSIDVTDNRFSVLHEDPNFAIDPSNPQFKKTKAMSAILEEGGKRRHKKRGEDKVHESSSTQKTEHAPERKLESLVESVKRKSFNHDRRGKGKRQKLL